MIRPSLRTLAVAFDSRVSLPDEFRSGCRTRFQHRTGQTEASDDGIASITAILSHAQPIPAAI